MHVFLVFICLKDNISAADWHEIIHPILNNAKLNGNFV